MRNNERANACFQAGVQTKDLHDATNSALSWAEYRDAKELGHTFWYISTHAGTLTTLLKDGARGAAAELSKRAKDLSKTLKGKKTLSKSEQKAYEEEIFRMKDRSYWLEVAAKAQCGDSRSRRSLRRFKIPALTGKKTKTGRQ